MEDLGHALVPAGEGLGQPSVRQVRELGLLLPQLPESPGVPGLAQSHVRRGDAAREGLRLQVEPGLVAPRRPVEAAVEGVDRSAEIRRCGVDGVLAAELAQKLEEYADAMVEKLGKAAEELKNRIINWSF